MNDTVIIPKTEYEQMKHRISELERQTGQPSALQRIQKLRDEVQLRLQRDNQPELTEEEELEIGGKITRIAIDTLVDNGEVRFERHAK